MAVKKKMPANKKAERGKNKTVVESKQVKPAHPKPLRKISKAQKFQLDLIARTNFNSCDGVKIANLLKDNRQMWRAVFMPLNSYSLRDLEKGIWHADMLHIYAEESYEYALEELVREQFDADEISWTSGIDAVVMIGTPEVKHRTNVILSAWWD